MTSIAMTASDALIYSMLLRANRDGETVSRRNLAERCNLSGHTIRRRLLALERKGVLRLPKGGDEIEIMAPGVFRVVSQQRRAAP